MKVEDDRATVASAAPRPRPPPSLPPGAAFRVIPTLINFRDFATARPRFSLLIQLNDDRRPDVVDERLSLKRP